MHFILLDTIKAAFLGVVEGITEFLPVSSTGHLILINQFVSFGKDFTVLFDVVIQMGAITAVLVYFRKKLWPFTGDKMKDKETRILWSKTIIGVLPVLFFGAIFAHFIQDKLFTPWVVATALFIGGLIILAIEKKERKATITSVSGLSFKTAFLIGLAQCLSMIPGTSRSAATIIGAMLLGASRDVAAEFSFFLAIPTMFAASAYSLLKYRSPLTAEQIFILFVGFFVSFAVALSVTKFFIRYIRENTFKVFGYYRIALSVLVALYFFMLP